MPAQSTASMFGWYHRLALPWRVLIGSIGTAFALGLSGLLVLMIALSMIWPRLPSIESVIDYRPKVPLRIFTADGVLIGEFGEERRSLVHLGQFPSHLKQAILSAEDDRFYEHGGIDYAGILRATMVNMTSGSNRQGASTITQLVARNFFLTTDRAGWRAYLRKIYEWMLAFKIEQSLTKDQILEVFMNQIYLGQRSFGFAQAAHAYYGKSVDELSIGEAAMLAGLPKAPTTNNPIVNPKRAALRQRYVLGRMRDLGYITEAQYTAAIDEPWKLRNGNATGPNDAYATHGEFVAEVARQLAYDLWKDDAYSRGLNVYTTVTKADQDAAYASLRRGVIEYDHRRGYRGPEAYVAVPSPVGDDWLDETLDRYPDNDDLLAAVVIEAGPKLVRAIRPGSDPIEISGNGLRFAQSALAATAQPNRQIRPGAIIRVTRVDKDWQVTQLPEAESAFVAVNTGDGAVRAMIGGFDFTRSKFNHVTQAWRQPGSGFKPFVYSAALEKGFSPATIVNDAPIVIDAAQTGGQAWEPKNYDNKYEGPMPLRRGLALSKNMVSIRVLQAIGPKYAQDYIGRFGFDPDKHPPYLTMALGAGSVTPWQMAGAFSVFANGGYKIQPYLVSKVTDSSGNVLAQAAPVFAGDEANRVIDARNAFVMDSMLRDVVRYGTGARAMQLKRTDLAGKSGTTNDSIDAWFNGYQPGLVAIAWMGFDQPRSLGERETGGGASLPIWMGYMAKALAGVPNVDRTMPAGVVQLNGDYYYVEHQPGQGVGSLGLTDPAAPGDPATPENTRSDAVKNELF